MKYIISLICFCALLRIFYSAKKTPLPPLRHENIFEFYPQEKLAAMWEIGELERMFKVENHQPLDRAQGGKSLHLGECRE